MTNEDVIPKSPDIFKAKEILSDRMCIMGDVPSHLLAFGAKDRVISLLQAVGPGGG